MEQKEKLHMPKVDFKYTWMWLCYFDVIIPAVVLILALILRGSFLGPFLQTMLDSYMRLIVCPIPSFQNFIGLAGCGIAAAVLIRAFKGRHRWDIILTCSLVLFLAIYFLLGLHNMFMEGVF